MEDKYAALEREVQELRQKQAQQTRDLFILKICLLFLLVVCGYQFWRLDRILDEIIRFQSGSIVFNDRILDLISVVEELLLRVNELLEQFYLS